MEICKEQSSDKTGKEAFMTKIRFWCTVHNAPLTNIGNGRFLDPTDSDEPEKDEDGYMSLDFSEYACSSDPEDVQFGQPEEGHEEVLPCDGEGWEMETK